MDNIKYDNDKRVVFVVTVPAPARWAINGAASCCRRAIPPCWQYGVHHFNLSGGITANRWQTATPRRCPQGAYETVLSTTFLLSSTVGRMQRILRQRELGRLRRLQLVWSDEFDSRHAAQSQVLDARDRRRRAQRHHRLGQWRIPILHRQHRQRRPGRRGQPGHHRPQDQHRH